MKNQTTDTRKAFPLIKAAMLWRTLVGGPMPVSIEDHLRNVRAFTMAHQSSL